MREATVRRSVPPLPASTSVPEAMSRKAASSYGYPLTSDLAAFEHQARTADLRDWFLPRRQRPCVLDGAGATALAACAGILLLAVSGASFLLRL